MKLIEKALTVLKAQYFIKHVHGKHKHDCSGSGEI